MKTIENRKRVPKLLISCAIVIFPAFYSCTADDITSGNIIKDTTGDYLRDTTKMIHKSIITDSSITMPSDSNRTSKDNTSKKGYVSKTYLDKK